MRKFKQRRLKFSLPILLEYNCLGYLLLLTVCLFACTSGTRVINNGELKTEISKETGVKIFKLQNREQFSQLPNISEDELIAIANKVLSQEGINPTSKNVVFCETVLFWHALYEELGVEFAISKETHDVVMTQDVLMITKLPIPDKSDSSSNSISEERALVIANDETRAYLDSLGAVHELGNFRTIACELENSWRIYYEDDVTWDSKDWNDLPNSHPPHYLIDKRDGKILYRSFAPNRQ